jgi:hypothetical protein
MAVCDRVLRANNDQPLWWLEIVGSTFFGPGLDGLKCFGPKSRSELFSLSIDFFNLKLSVDLKIRDAFIRPFVSND